MWTYRFLDDWPSLWHLIWIVCMEVTSLSFPVHALFIRLVTDILLFFSEVRHIRRDETSARLAWRPSKGHHYFWRQCCITDGRSYNPVLYLTWAACVCVMNHSFWCYWQQFYVISLSSYSYGIIKILIWTTLRSLQISRHTTLKRL